MPPMSLHMCFSHIADTFIWYLRRQVWSVNTCQCSCCVDDAAIWCIFWPAFGCCALLTLESEKPVFIAYENMFLGIKTSTSVRVQAPKTSFCLIFLEVFSFFTVFKWKTWKKQISTSVCHAQHPNANQKIQQLLFMFYSVFLLLKTHIIFMFSPGYH